MADVKKYTFKISNSRPFWSINSVDKPYDINDHMAWTNIDIQNVNFIDAFTISFIADLDNYTYLSITDTTVSSTNATTATKYYYIETTSKRLTKGYEFVGKLDVWATFCGTVMVNHARFPQNYPLFVNRFINNKRAMWDAYYSSSAYMMKDEMFDYTHLPLTTDPNGYSISGLLSSVTTKHNMLFVSFYSWFSITFNTAACFSVGAYPSFKLNQTWTPAPTFGSAGNSYIYNLSALRMHSKYASPLLGLLYQADNDSGTYRLVVCGLKECVIIIDHKPNTNKFLGDYKWTPYPGTTLNLNVNNSYVLKLAGLRETINAIKTAYPYIDGLDNSSQTAGYWYNKIKGIYYLDFIDMLEIGNDKWHFTTLNPEGANDIIYPFNSNEDTTFNLSTMKPLLLFRDFEPQEAIPVTNRQKWRFTSIPTSGVLTSTDKPNYITWNAYRYNTYNAILQYPTIKTTMNETYTRDGTNTRYLQRYPLSRISVDNVCLNPAFPDYFNTTDNSSGTDNYYGSTGFFDTGKALIGFDGVSWVMSTGYNSKYLLTSAFTQESYPCNYSGYQNYINGVRSQQAAALTTAKHQQIFSGTMSAWNGLTGIISGVFSAIGAAKGDSGLVGDAIGGIMGGVGSIIGGNVQAHLNYMAKERQIEAQNQDKRRTSQVNVVQAGNTQATGINNAKSYWYQITNLSSSNYRILSNLVSCNFAVNAPNSLTDIHYYNSLVWKFGIQANFLIDAYTILEPNGENSVISNPFTYFEIQELPDEFILRIYSNLQKDYINAIKAVFSGGVRQWVNGNYPKYNSADNIVITWR